MTMREKEEEERYWERERETNEQNGSPVAAPGKVPM